MNTDQGLQLAQAIREVKARSNCKILVLMGGLDFFSNGINLNTIEASSDPAQESWRNINAINNVVKEVLMCRDKVTISAMLGNAGAGGIMAALAADFVWTHGTAVVSPSYKKMDLFGSEYWTYSLPKRVGSKVAMELTNCTEPMSSQHALKLGLVDKVLCPNYSDFVPNVIAAAEELAESQQLKDVLVEKSSRDWVVFEEKIELHRKFELHKMKECFHTVGYNMKRAAFVYKSNLLPCCIPTDDHNNCLTCDATEMEILSL